MHWQSLLCFACKRYFVSSIYAICAANFWNNCDNRLLRVKCIFSASSFMFIDLQLAYYSIRGAIYVYETVFQNYNWIPLLRCIVNAITPKLPFKLNEIALVWSVEVIGVQTSTKYTMWMIGLTFVVGYNGTHAWADACGNEYPYGQTCSCIHNAMCSWPFLWRSQLGSTSATIYIFFFFLYEILSHFFSFFYRNRLCCNF